MLKCVCETNVENELEDGQNKHSRTSRNMKPQGLNLLLIFAKRSLFSQGLGVENHSRLENNESATVSISPMPPKCMTTGRRLLARVIREYVLGKGLR